jgi:putative FmdB family regulatory protein
LKQQAVPRYRGRNSPEGTMPLYEYKCKACAHRFERIVKFSDAPLKKCPKCGKDAIQQLISAPAIQFKGSGWYVSDYGPNKSAADSSGHPGSAHSNGGSESISASQDNGNGNGNGNGDGNGDGNGSATLAPAGSGKASESSASSGSNGGTGSSSSSSSGSDSGGGANSGNTTAGDIK